MALATLTWTPPGHPAIDVVFAKVTEPFGTIPVGTYAVPSCSGTAKERHAAFGRLDKIKGGPVRCLVRVLPSDLVGLLRNLHYRGNTEDILRGNRKGERTALLLTNAIQGQKRFLSFPWPEPDWFRIAPVVLGAAVAHTVPPVVRTRARTPLMSFHAGMGGALGRWTLRAPQHDRWRQ
jgi:hypothetical protein